MSYINIVITSKERVSLFQRVVPLCVPKRTMLGVREITFTWVKQKPKIHENWRRWEPNFSPTGKTTVVGGHSIDLLSLVYGL